jgi:hypothetical protein
MSWKLGQTIFSISQGRIGILLKVHESDGLLAVKVAPKEAYGWAITDCLPVDETTSEWQQWRRGQIVYWGMEGRHGKIIGWEQDHKQIIVQAARSVSALISRRVSQRQKRMHSPP